MIKYHCDSCHAECKGDKGVLALSRLVIDKSALGFSEKFSDTAVKFEHICSSCEDELFNMVKEFRGKTGGYFTVDENGYKEIEE